MTWNNHTTNISNKCSRNIGVLNRIKYFIPLIVRILLYNTLILPHFNFCITAWGYQCDRIIKLQIKAIRIISISTYNAHTERLEKNRAFCGKSMKLSTHVHYTKTSKFSYSAKPDYAWGGCGGHFPKWPLSQKLRRA